MEGISIKGIFLGIVAIIVLDVISGIGLTVALGNEGSFDSDEAIDQLVTSTGFLVGSLILGTLSTVVGGYVAARIAKVHKHKNAAVIGILGIIIGIFFAGEYPLWFNTFAFLFVLPSALLGGHLALHRKTSDA